MPPAPTPPRDAGPYRSVAFSSAVAAPRVRWRRRAFAALLAAVGAVAFARRPPVTPAPPAARPSGDDDVVLRSLALLRPLAGVTRLQTAVVSRDDSTVVMAALADGTWRALHAAGRLPPRGAPALRAVASPLVCAVPETPDEADLCAAANRTGYDRVSADARREVSSDPSGGASVRCGVDSGEPPFVVRGDEAAAGDGWFCVRAGGVARCFDTVTADDRGFALDPASIAADEFRVGPDVLGVAINHDNGCLWRASGGVDCANERSAPGFARVARVDGVDRLWPAAAPDAFCARGRGGRVWCRGPSRDEPLREVPELAGAEQVVWRTATAGCALLPGGRVACWGEDEGGSLADGSALARSVPHRVDGVGPVATIAAGGAHACAVDRDGVVWCWGDNAHGQLGDGADVPRATPRAVALPGAAAEVAAGPTHTCARLREGEVWCWGEGDLGELGDGREGDARSPVRVAGLGDAAELSVGVAHSCARTLAGEVRCWGRFERAWPGQPRVHGALTPLRVGLAEAAVRLRSFGDVACAELAGGGARCWGAAPYRRLDAPASDPSTGDDFAFPDDSLAGYASSGALNYIDSPRSLAASLMGAGGAARVAAATTHRCALTADGAVWCEGGRTAGDGRWDERASLPPARARGLRDARTVTAGEGFSCALTADGAVWCWGANDRGQLGDGRALVASRPVLAMEEAAP